MSQQITVEGFKGLGDMFAAIQTQVNEGLMEDVEILLEDTMPELEEDHLAFFRQRRSPKGTAWAKLAPSTIRMKGHDQILIDTHDLLNSLTTPSGDYAIREFFREGDAIGLEFGTGVPYAHFHMTGSRNMPARPEVGLTEDRIQDFQTKLADLALEHSVPKGS